MYHGRPSLRWLTYLGTLGLAGLGPARDRAPIWLIVGVMCLPIALYELGAGLVVESASERWQRLGRRIQLWGGLAYVGLLAGGVGAHRAPTRGFVLLLALASLGVLAAAIVWWDHLRLARGEPPVAADPLQAGERLVAPGARGAAGRVADTLAIVGGMPLLLGGISLAFVAVASVVLGRHRGATPVRVWIALAFFAGCGLVAFAQALERWESFVPGRRVRRLRVGVQLLAFALFGGSLLAIGIVSLDDPRRSRPRAVFMIAGGGLFLAGGVAYAWLRAGSGRSRTGYDFVREGVLERTRRGAFLYPWEAIRSLTLGEFQHHMALYVLLADDESVEGPLPASRLARSPETNLRLAKRCRSLARSRALLGADLIVLDGIASSPVGELFRLARAALDDPVARAALPSVIEVLALEI